MSKDQIVKDLTHIFDIHNIEQTSDIFERFLLYKKYLLNKDSTEILYEYCSLLLGICTKIFD